MLFNHKDFKRLLTDASKGLISQADLARLVQICRSIAESYLSYRRRSLIHICSVNGLALSDLAIDCIGNLFARDEKGHFYQFKNFLHSLDSGIGRIPENELFLAFKSFTLKVVSAQLARIYQEVDPIGARIHRNVKFWAKKLSFIRIIEDHRGFVLTPAASDPLDHLPACHTEHLEAKLIEGRAHGKNIPDLLKQLSKILEQQEGYRRTIPLIEAVQVLRAFYLHFADLNSREDDEQMNYEGEQIDLEFARNKALSAIQEKIFTTYLLPGKLNKEEAHSLSEALTQLINDWCNGIADKKSLANYIVQNLSITTEDYQNNWRTKVEYLIRIARETFAACLEKNI